MILSHRHKFIFIKGRKTGSTSTEVALSRICGDDDVITPITPVDEKLRVAAGRHAQNFASDKEAEKRIISNVKSDDPKVFSTALDEDGPFPFYNHMSLTAVEDRFPQGLNGYRVIATERSPYSKVLSLANFKSNFPHYKLGGRMQRSVKLKSLVDKVIESGLMLRVRNIDLYKRKNGNLQVQFFRQEALERDLLNFIRTLAPDSSPKIPHLKDSGTFLEADAVALFSRSQLDIINQHFSEEFEAYGYERY